jgi:hypothetical protein
MVKETEPEKYTVLGGGSGAILVESGIMALIKAEGDDGPSLDNAYAKMPATTREAMEIPWRKLVASGELIPEEID